MKLFLIIFVIKTIWIQYASCKLADTKIYKPLSSEFICFRRFNKTHQTGCQSNDGGNVGTVHFIYNEQDLDHVLKDGLNHPYMPCLNISSFTSENLIKFRDSKRVSGVILLHKVDEKKITKFSEDSQCPNQETSLYKSDSQYGYCKKQIWNKAATSNDIMSLDLNFPIFLIKDQKNITSLEKCFFHFNVANKQNQVPLKANSQLCSVQLESRMIGAKNSVTCMSRNPENTLSLTSSTKYCDAMRSLNIFSSYFKYEPSEKIKNRSVLMLAAKLDALSIFENSATGIDTTITSLIVFLSIVDTLNKLREEIKQKRKDDLNILFSLFDGESFDYIGSGKTAYDLGTTGLGSEKGIFGINNYNQKFFKYHINSVFELNQLAPHGKKLEYFLHTDPISKKNDKVYKGIKKLIDLINKNNKPKIEIRETDENQPLPPSSVQQLIAHDPDLPAIVLTNHEKEFKNKFYNSFLDTPDNLNYKIENLEYISSLSSILSKTLYEFLTGIKKDNIEVDKNLITTLADCFFKNIRCKYLSEIRGYKSVIPENIKYFPLYISASYPQVQQYHFEFIHTVDRLLAYLSNVGFANSTDENNCSEKTQTTNTSTFEWFKIDNKDLCLETTRFFSVAISPIFINDEPNWNLNYSTWTESVWESPQARFFLAPSDLQQNLSFGTGLFIFLLSFYLVYWIHKNSGKLFSELQMNNNEGVTGL